MNFLKQVQNQVSNVLGVSKKAVCDNVAYINVQNPNNSDVSAILLSPNNQYITVGCLKDLIFVYDLYTKERLYTLSAATYSATALTNSYPSFSNDGAYFTSKFDNEARIWIATDFTKVASLVNPYKVYTLTFSPNGRTLVCGGKDQLYVWDLNTQTLTFSLEASAYSILSSGGNTIQPVFSLDGKYLFARFLDCVKIFDCENNYQSIGLLQCLNKVTCLVLSPNGQYLAVGTTSSFIKVFSIYNNFNCIATLDGQTWSSFTSVKPAFSNDSRFLLARFDNFIRIWDIQQNFSKMNPLQLPDEVFTINFSPDGQYLAIGCINEAIYILNFSSFNRIVTLQGQVYSGITGGMTIEPQFTSDSKQILFRFNESVRIFQILPQQKQIDQPSQQWQVVQGQPIYLQDFQQQQVQQQYQYPVIQNVNLNQQNYQQPQQQGNQNLQFQQNQQQQQPEKIDLLSYQYPNQK